MAGYSRSIGSAKRMDPRRSISPTRSKRDLPGWQPPKPHRPHSRLDKLIRKSDVPGPSHYSLKFSQTERRNNTGQMARHKRWSPIKTNPNTSPQKYSIKFPDQMLRRGKLSFGKTKRFRNAIEEEKKKYPGPKYSSHQVSIKLMRRSPSQAWGKSKKVLKSGIESERTPSPAKYQPEFYFHPLPGRPSSPQRRPRSSQRSRPASPHRSSPARRPATSQLSRRPSHQRHSSANRRQSSPDRRARSSYRQDRKWAMSHSPQSKHKIAAAFSFGSSPKMKSKPSTTPGCKYDTISAHQKIQRRSKGIAFQKSKRMRQNKEKQNIPSPQRYAVSYKALERSAARPVMDRQRRFQEDREKSGKPAPGQYKLRYGAVERRGKSISFQTEKRMKKKRSETPGVGRYDSETAYQFTSQVKNAPRAVLYYTGA